jgi:predicted TIM-barrel fold metal-dependent hydrolase
MPYQVISADNHVVEPPGTFVDRVPSVLKERVPRVLPGKDGGEGWSWDGAPPTRTFALDSMGTRGRGLGFAVIPRGQWDGAAHLADMRSDGIDAAVLYPGIGGQLYGHPDREAAVACFRAYNDWLLDDFCGADPTCLIGMPMIPTDDGFDVMMNEAERVVAKGTRGVFLPYTSTKGLYDPFYDPLWKLLSEANVVGSLHNFGGTPPPTPEGIQPTNLRASTTVGSFFSAPGPLTHMIFVGIFERFPALKFIAAEVNVGWVPYWLQQMHMTIERPHMKGGNWYPYLPTETPEDYLGKNIFFTVLDDYFGFRMMKEDARIANATMWSVDYPHGVSLWGQNREFIDQLTQGMGEQTKFNILAGNAMRVFGLN